jgi:hypothetical protein
MLTNRSKSAGVCMCVCVSRNESQYLEGSFFSGCWVLEAAFKNRRDLPQSSSCDRENEAE